jgi:hypothetical protein
MMAQKDVNSLKQSEPASTWKKAYKLVREFAVYVFEASVKDQKCERLVHTELRVSGFEIE